MTLMAFPVSSLLSGFGQRFSLDPIVMFVSMARGGFFRLLENSHSRPHLWILQYDELTWLSSNYGRGRDCRGSYLQQRDFGLG